MYPNRARDCAQYDPTTRQLRARDWQGNEVVFETPAELIHALESDRLFARGVVHAAALWFAADHGVPWVLSPGSATPVVRLQQRSAQEGYSLSALQRCYQAIDRGFDQTARLLAPMIQPDDVVAIVDRDGFMAAVCTRVCATEHPGVPIVWHRDDTLAAGATVVLVHTTVNREGCPTDRRAMPALAAAQAAALSRYGLVPFGPVDGAGVLPADTLHAVCTGRGMYRPDRITRYDDDSDIGPDIISLT
ncbi:MAG: hypothetical protein RLZZ297_383 [Chloroflexota bacterium]